MVKSSLRISLALARPWLIAPRIDSSTHANEAARQPQWENAANDPPAPDSKSRNQDVERHFIVNAIKTVDCIDEANREEPQPYDQADSAPERRGAYRWISGLRIDPAKTGGALVLRPMKFKTAFIVSEEVKNALEQAGNLGVSFEHVTSSLGGQ